MASNDEGQGSGDCDNVYLAADEFLSLADDQPMLLLGHRSHRGLRPTRKPVLRLRPTLPRGAEPV